MGRRERWGTRWPHRCRRVCACLSSRSSPGSSRCCRRFASRSSTSAASSTPGQGLGRGRRPLGADVPRRLRGRPAQPGRQILYEVLNERAGRPRRAHVRRLARPRGAHARARRSRSSPSTGTGRSGAFDLLGRQLLHRARLHQPAHRARPRRHPAARARPRPTSTRSSSPAGTRRSTPSRSPSSSTPQSSATASRPCSRSPTSSRRWKAEGRPGGRDELLLRLARTGGVYVPAFYDVEYLPDGRIRRVAPNRPGVPWRVAKHTVMDLDAVALPEAAAGAARRDGARADERRDLPRLHPRLPVLPGRDDHPAGARAQHHRHRRDGGAAGWPRPATRRSAC